MSVNAVRHEATAGYSWTLVISVKGKRGTLAGHPLFLSVNDRSATTSRHGLM